MSPAQFAQGTPKQPIWYPHVSLAMSSLMFSSQTLTRRQLPLYLVESKYTTNPAGLNVPTHSSRPFSKLSNWKNLVTSCLDLRPTPLQIQKQPSPLLNQTGRTLPNPIGGLLPTDSNYTPAAQTSKRALGDDTPSGNSDSSPDLKRSRTTPLTDLPSYPPYSTPFTSGSASHSLTAPTNSLLSMSTSASAETLTPSHPQLPPLQHPSDVSSRTPDSIKGVKRFNQWQGQAAEKPPFTYASLVAQAIYHSPGRAATLDQIYRFIVEQYPYYLQEDAKSWHNSIRHNLSLRQCFVKNERDGKNALWSLSIPQGSEESFDGLNLSTGKTNSRRTTSNSSSIPSYRRTSGGSISSTTTGASSLFDSVSDVSSMSAATPPVPWLHPYSAANLQKIEQQQPWPQAAAPAETEPKSSASIDTQATVTVAEASTEVDPAAEAAAAFEVTDAAKAFLGAHQGKPERPPFTFAALCAQAITQAPNGAPSLAEIYEYIQDSYPFFQKDAKGWQVRCRNSLCHFPRRLTICVSELCQTQPVFEVLLHQSVPSFGKRKVGPSIGQRRMLDLVSGRVEQV